MCFPIPICFRRCALHSTVPNFDFSFTNQHLYAVPHPCCPCAQRRALYDYSYLFIFDFRTPLHLAYDAVRISYHSPLTHSGCRIHVPRMVPDSNINIPMPGLFKGNSGPYLLFVSLACFTPARPVDDKLSQRVLVRFSVSRFAWSPTHLFQLRRIHILFHYLVSQDDQ